MMLKDDGEEPQADFEPIVPSPPNSKLANAVLLLRGVIAVIGVVVFWTGCWNYLDLQINGDLGADEHSDDGTYQTRDDPKYSLGKEMSLFLVGLFWLVVTDVLFIDAAINVRKPQWHFRHWHACSNGALLYVQSTLGLLAGVTYWVGLYNLFDIHIFPWTKRWDYLCSFVGIAGLVILDTFIPYGGLILEAPLEWSELNIRSRSVLYFQAVASSSAGVLAWKGIYNVLSYWSWDPSLNRELGYFLSGFALIILTNTLTMSSGTFNFNPVVVEHVEEDEDEQTKKSSKGGYALETTALHPPPKSSRVFQVLNYFRATVAFCAGFVFWTGAWNILSDHMWDYTALREGMYCLFGFAILLVTNTLVGNAGITPISLAHVSQVAKNMDGSRGSRYSRHEADDI